MNGKVSPPQTWPEPPNDSDGGPAFPRPLSETGGSGGREYEFEYAQEGMSLRDYFAAHALSAVDFASGNSEWIAKEAYEIADAMLKARGAK